MPTRSLVLRTALALLLVQGAASGALVAGVYVSARSALRGSVERAEAARLASAVAERVALYALGGTALTVGAAALVLLGSSRRMREIARAATAHAGGDFGARAGAQPSSELDALAHAVNASGERMASRVSELRSQTGQLEAILHAMNAGVLALDREQRILRLNPAAERLLGVKAHAARGKLLQEAMREPELNRFVEDAMADPTLQGDEFDLHRGTRLTVRANSGQLRDPQGVPVGLLIVLTDITELRRLETMRTDFAANVSHELRTPITNIKGYLETLTDAGFSDEEQARRFLDVIARNADRLGAIVEDLLLLTRLERTGPEEALATMPTAARSIIEAVVAQLDSAARAKDMRIEVRVQGGLAVEVNPQLAELALSNLVLNAVKYSPARSRVVVAARRLEPADEAPRAMIELSVADEGQGVAPEHLDRIFERFFRVDKARSREQGGTGLGLAIVKHIALVHGGRVEATSEIGRGSTFRLVLPAAERDGPGK